MIRGGSPRRRTLIDDVKNFELTAWILAAVRSLLQLTVKSVPSTLSVQLCKDGVRHSKEAYRRVGEPALSRTPAAGQEETMRPTSLLYHT